ncbi:myeloid lymphoid or mixed-lineage leukemia 5 (trithorax, ) [Tulasnella sp. 330]|nr:myeloid lymphoid or mixed-lineage leukemia 5 (trithorax, ) [Tulasnella sp. 330]KAG8883760.1 myeloid lymphoid or mixed-lineage leukemia 5 (trithorax, ) [Tulasnella sp. 331]
MNPNQPSASSSSSLPTLQPPSPPLDTGRIRCICTYTEDDGDTIFCEGCGYWQHLSCLGLTSMHKDDLPDRWFCHKCKPDQFEWVQSSGAPGNTLASSLGISYSHWRTDYVASQKGVGLGLEIVPNTSPTSSLTQPFTVRSASSSLRISNLLSPAPGTSAANAPFPATPPPKILLDPAKAKKRQEERQLEDARMKKHQSAGAGASGVGSNGVSSGDATAGRNSNVNGSGGPVVHGRKGSVAVAAEGAKGKGKKAATGATAGAGSSKVSSGLADTSSAAGPSSINGTSSTAATSTKRKASAIASAKPKAKDKDTRTPAPDSTPRLTPYVTLPSASTTPQGPYTTPYLPNPNHSPRYYPQNLYSMPRSPSMVHASNGVGVYGRNGGAITGNGVMGSAVGHQVDYFSSLPLPPNGKGKDRERDDPFYPLAATPQHPPDGYSTLPPTPYHHHPPNGVLDPHHHQLQYQYQGLAITATNAAPSSPIPHEQQQPLPPQRSTHHSMLKFGTGSKITVPKGASTGSEVTRPKPLVIRSFPGLPDGDGDGGAKHSASRGISLFLDPIIPKPSSPVRDHPALHPQTRPNPDPTAPQFRHPSLPLDSTSTHTPRVSSLTLPAPQVHNYIVQPSSPLPRPPSHQHHDSNDLHASSNSAIITNDHRAVQDAFNYSLPVTYRPNAVVRPLLCQKEESSNSAKGADAGVIFAVFTLRALAPGEAIVLGWEKTELSGERYVGTITSLFASPDGMTHLRCTFSFSAAPQSHSRTLSYIGDTFTTCGTCGRKAKECAEEVIAANAKDSDAERIDEDDRGGVLGMGKEKEKDMGGDTDTVAASKRSRSVLESEGAAELAGGSSSADEGSRAPKRIKLANGTSVPVSRNSPIAAPATPVPQVHVTPILNGTAESTSEGPINTAGQDLSLRRVRAEPGMPLHPSPRLTHRANWLSHLKSSQAQQKEILSRVSAPLIESSIRVPIPSSSSFPSHPSSSTAPSLLIPSASASLSKPRTPGHRPTSTPSSPLTEQSESANDDADDDVNMMTPVVRSPRLGVNGRGGDVKKPSKVRIQSTPPSDSEQADPLGSSVVLGPDFAMGLKRTDGQLVEEHSTLTVGPVVVLHPPASSDKPAELPMPSVPAELLPHQRGPPKLRRWFTKLAAPPASTPAPAPELALPPLSLPSTTPAAPSPCELPSPKPLLAETSSKSIEADSLPKAANSSKSAQRPHNEYLPNSNFPPHPIPQLPPIAKASSTTSAMSFSINNLLNPAPERRSRVHTEPVVLVRPMISPPAEVVVIAKPSPKPSPPAVINSPFPRHRSLSPIRQMIPASIPSPPIQDVLPPVQLPSTFSPHSSTLGSLPPPDHADPPVPEVIRASEQVPEQILEDEDVVMNGASSPHTPQSHSLITTLLPIPGSGPETGSENAVVETPLEKEAIMEIEPSGADPVVQDVAPLESSSSHRSRRLSDSSNDDDESSADGGAGQRRGSSPLSEPPSDLTDDRNAVQRDTSSMSPTAVDSTARSAPVESEDSLRLAEMGKVDDTMPMVTEPERSPSPPRVTPEMLADPGQDAAAPLPPSSPIIQLSLADPNPDEPSATTASLSPAQTSLPLAQANGLVPPHSPSMTSLSVEASTPPVEPGSPQTPVRKTLTFKEAFQARRLKAQQEKEKALGQHGADTEAPPAVVETRIMSEGPSPTRDPTQQDTPDVDSSTILVTDVQPEPAEEAAASDKGGSPHDIDNQMTTETQDIIDPPTDETQPNHSVVTIIEQREPSMVPTIKGDVEVETEKFVYTPQSTPHQLPATDPHEDRSPHPILPPASPAATSPRTPPRTPLRTPLTRGTMVSSESPVTSPDVKPVTGGASGASPSVSPRAGVAETLTSNLPTSPKPSNLVVPVAKPGRTRFSSAFGDIPSPWSDPAPSHATVPSAKLSSPSPDREITQHSRTTTNSEDDRQLSTVPAERRSSLKLRDRISDFTVVATPLEESVAQKVGLAIVDSVRERDRFQTSPLAAAKKPPTEPRNARAAHIPPVNTVVAGAAEEGEITSPMHSPAPSGSQNGRNTSVSQSNVPTQPRSQRAPSIAASGRSSPPPPAAGRPPILHRAPPTQPRNNTLPSAPRALREGPGPPAPPRGGSRLGGSGPSFRDGERERERTWERDSDRSRDERLPRDGRERDWRWDRDRDRESYSRRGRGGGRGGR